MPALAAIPEPSAQALLKEPSWQRPEVQAVKAQAMAWLEQQKADAQVRSQAEEIWSAESRGLPGDEILGFVTRGGGVSVHRDDCTNAAALRAQEERLLPVRWAPSPSSVFLVAIQVEALDRHRLLSDITRELADERVNILSATVQTTRDRVAVSKFTFEMGDPKHLGHVLNVVRNVEGVYDVYRVTSARNRT